MSQIKKIIIQTTEKKQVADITEEINKNLPNDNGVAHLFATHTTCALTTADLDPGTDLDMLDAFEAMAPKLKYRHPHNPAHAPDHIMSSIIGTNLSLPYENGKLVLGTWQRVVLIEFNGPRERKIVARLYYESFNSRRYWISGLKSC
jgi:secondary thiamine-phosphate synthase enzyme